MDATLTEASDEAFLEEYSRRFEIVSGDAFNNAQQVARHLQGLLGGARRETFVALYLTQKNVLIDSEILFTGTVNQAAVYPREIVRSALLKDASNVICGHNHPSGNIKPSNDDIEITRKLNKALDLLDITLLDHVIIGGDKWFSFADHNLLQKGGQP